MAAPEPDAIQHQMDVLSRSLKKAIRSYLVIESELPPLPARDDPRYEAVRLLHLGTGLRTIGRHPVWDELR